jgi:hypothetical protein
MSGWPPLQQPQVASHMAHLFSLPSLSPGGHHHSADPAPPRGRGLGPGGSGEPPAPPPQPPATPAAPHPRSLRWPAGQVEGAGRVGRVYVCVHVNVRWHWMRAGDPTVCPGRAALSSGTQIKAAKQPWLAQSNTSFDQCQSLCRAITSIHAPCGTPLPARTVPWTPPQWQPHQAPGRWTCGWCCGTGPLLLG